MTEAPPAARSSAQSHPAARILILDDEPMILIDLSFALEDEGASAVTAGSAPAALDVIDETPPDAAILDVNLGGGRTCEPVAARLRELGIPFLIHSGDLDRQGELVAQFGVRVIPKPTPGSQIAKAALRLVRQAAEA
ncbi:response regulator [Parvularcula dongshanensis]|uniref:DNA-binding response OmpR family regulator n=1 Tax=Parvularcula dongshanensis TaxID=1173995 RepID=A0A840HXS9_9PROT|nr:response regulator [Parvularcula dongshanensis]MBB4657646.1 DNA-binding response OmpR family regulator [Parvularcula dongshanensis]